MTNESSEPLQDAVFAQQWITFLRKRNTVLNILWPLLLIVAIVTSLGAFYYYQVGVNTQLNLTLTTSKLDEQRQASADLQMKIEAARIAYERINDENEFLKTDKAQLSAKQNDSVSQLGITSQIVATLKSQVQVFRTENDNLLETIEESKALLIQQQKKNSTQLSDAEDEHTKQTDSLNKQLSARKVAYEALVKRQRGVQGEADRLSDSLRDKNKQLKSVKNNQSKLNNELQLAEQKLQRVNADYKSLELRHNQLSKNYKALSEKLQLAVSPIGGVTTNGVTTQAKVSNTISKKTSVKSPSAMQMGDGLDAIEKPLTVRPFAKPNRSEHKKSSNSAAFDYDKITVN